jgi:citrate lyase subunit beta/citryl-CoA lyase
MLILPINNPRFVEKAHLRGADAIVLDLEDAVPPSEKDTARRLVKDAIELVGRGGADVMVRVNHEPSLLEADLAASVHRGLHGIFVPKIESADEVRRLEATLSDLESERGIPPGHVKLSLHVETPRGLLNMREIACAGDRAESMSLGVDDYCLQLGIEPSEEGTELLVPLTMMVIVCRAAGLSPLGILGTVAGFKDTDGFEKAAVRGRNLGCSGAYCIHPGQVPILNRVFSPAPVEVDHARRAVEAFELGLKQGKAAVSLDGSMVDTPIYKRAKLILERAAAIEQTERRKAEALRRYSYCQNE